ncbi:MAG: hypothetical protein J7647_28565 [Cyanobacteria bacterium SBLK]|nr:hypothetical protein [Cyanobacteria bacterium SBLK]
MKDLFLKNWKLIGLQILFLITVLLDIADIFADFSVMWWVNQLVSIAIIIGLIRFCTPI